MSLFTIPSNIKQSYLPFVLNPDAPINKNVDSSTELKDAKPQVFSFIPNEEGRNLGAGYGKIKIFPESFNNFINDDLGYLMLVARNRTNAEWTSGGVTADLILNELPKILIREFLPDTRLDQAVNFISDLMNTMKSMFVKDKDSKTNEQNKLQETEELKAQKNQSFFDKLTKACKWTLNYITGVGSENIYTDMQKSLSENGADENYDKAKTSTKNYILNFPFILYYQFLSSVTTNIYEIPGQVEGNKLYSSTGHEGWDGTSSMELIPSFIKQLGPIGNLANNFLGNVRVNFLPWWESGPGHATAEPDINIKFDLFNDDAKSAVMNFIFVNTLIPNNKWILYNMFLHSSSLYDVKIEGYNRLFACTGSFEVTYKGVLRNPSTLILALLEKYLNTLVTQKLNASKILSDKLIKIPDVYSVNMTFKSVLPANFNTFIFNYSHNNNHIEKYSSKDGSYKESVAIKLLNDGIKGYITKIKSHWNSGNFPGVEDKKTT